MMQSCPSCGARDPDGCLCSREARAKAYESFSEIERRMLLERFLKNAQAILNQQLPTLRIVKLGGMECELMLSWGARVWRAPLGTLDLTGTGDFGKRAREGMLQLFDQAAAERLPELVSQIGHAGRCIERVRNRIKGPDAEFHIAKALADYDAASIVQIMQGDPGDLDNPDIKIKAAVYSKRKD